MEVPLNVMKFSNMPKLDHTFELVQIQYDTYCFIIWILNMSKLVQNQYYYDSYDSQTCLNLFRFNMIQIVPIHMILKHVQTCSDSICTYNAYCYDSYGFLTCQNLLCRECVRMGARTRRSFGHHLLHPQILTQQLFFEKSYSHRLQLISYIPSHWFSK